MRMESFRRAGIGSAKLDGSCGATVHRRINRRTRDVLHRHRCFDKGERALHLGLKRQDRARGQAANRSRDYRSFIAATGLAIERIGLEAGCTAAWLFAGLRHHKPRAGTSSLGKKSTCGGGSLCVVWGVMRGHYSPGIIKKVARSIQSNATVLVLPGLAGDVPSPSLIIRKKSQQNVKCERGLMPRPFGLTASESATCACCHPHQR
jgi:hypothetical protein